LAPFYFFADWNRSIATVNKMMSDINNIYNLYMENAAQPQMTTDVDGAKKMVAEWQPAS
jgi:hypothetical protein